MNSFVVTKKEHSDIDEAGLCFVAEVNALHIMC